MSNNDQLQENESQLVELSELEILKQRATKLGIPYRDNISVAALKQKIQDKTEPTTLTEVEQDTRTLRQRIHDESMRLIRLRITNLDPKKKDLHGEILTVANEYLGTIRKFVPFGEQTDNGYHVPYCIYQMMLDRKFLHIRTVKDKDSPTGTRIEQNWANEFALDILPPLTQEELDTLAASQAANVLK